MNRYVVVPHHGQSRFRLARHGRTVLFATGDGPAAAALAGWCRLFGDRPPAEILEELERVTSDNPALGAFVLAVLDDDGVEVAVNGGLPVAGLPIQVKEVLRAVAPLALYGDGKALARMEWVPLEDAVGEDEDE